MIINIVLIGFSRVLFIKMVSIVLLSSSSTPNHLPTKLEHLAAAGAGSGGIASAAAIAMQAAAQAVNYQQSLHSVHSAVNLVNDMKAAKLQSPPISKPLPTTLLSTMMQHQSALGRYPFLPDLHAALSSPRSPT